MTKSLEQAIEKVRALPATEQDALADLLSFMADPKPYQPSHAERAGIERGVADADAGRFAPAASIAALFAPRERA